MGNRSMWSRRVFRPGETNFARVFCSTSASLNPATRILSIAALNRLVQVLSMLRNRNPCAAAIPSAPVCRISIWGGHLSEYSLKSQSRECTSRKRLFRMDYRTPLNETIAVGFQQGCGHRLSAMQALDLELGSAQGVGFWRILGALVPFLNNIAKERCPRSNYPRRMNCPRSWNFYFLHFRP